jgi:N utilization substance protein B
MSAGPGSKTSPGAAFPAAARRSAARLSAVQALYQIELTGAAPDPVISQFTDPKSRDQLTGEQLVEPDAELFGDLVRGVVAGRADLDRLIADSLTVDWEIGRLDLILRLIMEAGAHEITRRPDIPARVAITEYVDVAHAFFDGAEPGLVNGVLDRIARGHRPGEMTAGGEPER